MKKIATSIAVLCCIAVALLVTSMAWFLNNTRVNADNTNAEASKDIASTVVYQRVESGKYNGETGKGTLGDPDAPYRVPFLVFMTNTLDAKTYHLYIKMDKLIITKGKPDVPPYLVETTDVVAEFTWRFTYLGEEYRPGVDGIAEAVVGGAPFVVPSGNITLEFDLIYLSESRYITWQSDAKSSRAEYDALTLDPVANPYLSWIKTQTRYFNYPEFLYCDPVNMGSTFYVGVKLGARQATGVVVP